MRLYDSAEGDVVEEAEKFKTALSQVLLSKAVEAKDPDRGSFLYLLSKILSELRIVKSNSVELLGIDGDVLHVGPLYEKFIEGVLRKRPGDVAKIKSFLLLHEALHRVFGHDVRYRLAGDKVLYNIVADLYVNTVLEHQLGLGGFEGFVTLETLSEFIIQHFGKQLTEEQIRAVRTLGRYEVENKLSVEQVYNTLVMLPRNVAESVKIKFSSGKFYGKDLGLNQPSYQAAAGENRRQNATSGRGAGQKPAEEARDKISVADASDEGSELGKELDEVASRLKDVAQRIYQALGEYQALKRMYECEKEVGTARGIMEYVEYKQVSSLMLQVHRMFMRDVGETLSEPRVTFERFDEEAYWLPAREIERRRAVLALVDASPSVPRKHLLIFLSAVVNSVHAFDIEYRLVVFGTGVLDEKVVTQDNIHAEIHRVPRGFGTVWDRSVAEKVREATARGVRLIQVLSDFWIAVTDEAMQAIAEFKNAGGVISCYSSTGEFLDFCDAKNVLPVLPER